MINLITATVVGVVVGVVGVFLFQRKAKEPDIIEEMPVTPPPPPPLPEYEDNYDVDHEVADAISSDNPFSELLDKHGGGSK